jgi:hypothetical protein
MITAFFMDSLFTTNECQSVFGEGSHSGPCLQLYSSLFKRVQVAPLEHWSKFKASVASSCAQNSFLSVVLQDMERSLRVGELFQFLLCEESGLLASSSILRCVPSKKQEENEQTVAGPDHVVSLLI